MPPVLQELSLEVSTHLKDYAHYYFSAYACTALLFASFASIMWSLIPLALALLYRYLAPYKALLVASGFDKQMAQKLGESLVDEFDIVFLYSADELEGDDEEEGDDDPDYPSDVEK